MIIRNKILSGIFMLLIVATIGFIVGIRNYHPPGDKFTEFYLLTVDDKAEDYPKQAIVGEEKVIYLGIVNHEYDEMSYWIEVSINGEKQKEVGPIVLNPGQKWEGEVAFLPEIPSIDIHTSEEIEFFLLKDGTDQPYSSLRLWVNITEEEPDSSSVQ